MADPDPPSPDPPSPDPPSPDSPSPASLRRIAGNLAKLLSGKAAAGIISLGYLVLGARLLGDYQYGLLNLLHGYATLVGGLVAFSGWHGMVRYGTQALVGDDPARLMKLFRTMALIELAGAALAIGVAMLLIPYVGPRLHWPPAVMALAPVYCLAILATVRATPHGYLQIIDRFDLVSAHQLVMPVVRLIGALWVWATGGGLIAFVWVWLLGALAEGISLWAIAAWQLARRGLLGGLVGPVRGVRADNPQILSFIATTNVDITLRELAPRAVPLIVGWVLGPAAAGVLAVAQRVSVILQQPAQSLGQASYPVITDMAVRRDEVALTRALSRSVAYATLAAAAIAVPMAIFAGPIMALVGGASFAAGAGVMILILISRVIQVGSPVLNAGLIGLGHPGDNVRVAMWCSLALLPLLPMMIAPGGLNLGLAGVGWFLMAQAAVTMGALALVIRSRLRQRAAA